MAQDKFQGSRFEQKYIITEEQALQMRDYVRAISNWMNTQSANLTTRIQCTAFTWTQTT